MDREQFLTLLSRLFGDGDPLTAEEIQSLIAAAPEQATDAELADIEAACQLLGADDETPLEAVRAAVDLVDAVRAEAASRIETAEAAAEERAALRARLAGEPLAQEEEEGDGEEAEPAAEPEPAEEPAPEEEPAEAVVDPEPAPAAEEAPIPEPIPEPVPVAASSTAPRPPARRAVAPRPAGATLSRRPAGAPVLRQDRQRNRIVGDNGRDFANLREVGEAMFATRQRFLRTTPGITEDVQIARILADYPDDRRLDPMNGARNAQVIAQLRNDLGGSYGVGAQGYDAVVAAGGPCAPRTPFYGIPHVSTNDRPVRDSLVGYMATRGGITFRPPSTIGDFEGAITEWTRNNDTTPGSDGAATKAVLTVTCPGTENADLWAVVRRLQFGNFMGAFDPEAVEEATVKTLDAHAREGEKLLLDEIKAQSTVADAGQVYGAFRDLLYHWGVAAARYRSFQRMRSDAVLELRAPAWVRDMIREDVARSLNATLDQFSVADQLINGALAVRNIRPYWYMDSPNVNGVGNNVDQIFGAQGTGALHDFREHVQWQMSPPGTFLFLENGELNLGVVRDSTLNDTNDYQTFGETFEGIAHIGYQSIWGISNVCANGASAGTSSPDGLCASSGEYVPTGSGLAAFAAA